MCREGARHEAYLDKRLDPRTREFVEDAVDQRPVVDGIALFVLGINIRARPLESERAVAAGVKMMHPDLNGIVGHLVQFSQQVFAFGRERRERLVVAEEIPDRTQFRRGPVGMDDHLDRRLRARQKYGARGQTESEKKSTTRRFHKPGMGIVPRTEIFSAVGKSAGTCLLIHISEPTRP